MISEVEKPTAPLPVFSYTPGVFATVSPPSVPSVSPPPQTSSTVVLVPQPISSPAGSYSSGIYGSNATLPTGTGVIVVPTKSSSGLTPNETDVFSGAGQVKVGGALAVVLATFVMFF